MAEALGCVLQLSDLGLRLEEIKAVCCSAQGKAKEGLRDGSSLLGHITSGNY